VTVRPARRSEANQLIDALTESFSDSALFDWLVLQDSEADRRRRLVFEAFVDILGFGHGEVWTTDDHAGVAIWHQPGQWRMEFADLGWNDLFEQPVRAEGGRLVAPPGNGLGLVPKPDLMERWRVG